MRWIKHLSNSQDDEVLSELITEFGAEGYGLWWIILEKIASQIEQKPTTSVRYSAKKWAGFGDVSVQKFRKVIRLLEKKMPTFVVEDDGRYIDINCPNILKFCDNWTQRKINKIDKSLGSNSVATRKKLRNEVEVEVEEEVEEIKNLKPFVGLPEKPQKIQPNDFHFLITDKIIKHVTTQKNINIDTRQRATWANAIRLLIEKDLAGENEDRIRRVEKAMDYVLENHTDQYCPVIESGTSFRKKFLKIENQMNKPLNIYQKQRPLSPYQQEMAIRDKLFKSLREENEQDSGYTETIEIGDSPKAII